MLAKASVCPPIWDATSPALFAKRTLGHSSMIMDAIASKLTIMDFRKSIFDTE
jgi:hypothetical protein